MKRTHQKTLKGKKVQKKAKKPRCKKEPFNGGLFRETLFALILFSFALTLGLFFIALLMMYISTGWALQDYVAGGGV